MRTYNAGNLVVHPHTPSGDPDRIVQVTPEIAGWRYIHFEARRLGRGRRWQAETGEMEAALVMLGGVLDVDSSAGSWQDVGERSNVFAGLPHALYLPRRTRFSLSARTDVEFGLAMVETGQDHPPRLVRPEDIQVEIRGGDNATRMINNILPPGSDVERLVVVEVYTPSGGWSSYPPHKHDRRRLDDAGRLVEADLEEIYYYKIDRPEGFAIQWVYTDQGSPLQSGGSPIDALLRVQNDDIVLVPEGYHPVVSPPGYRTYYLNILAGSDQALTAVDDPRFSWVKQSYTTRNPAVPLYDISRAAGVSS